MVSSTTKTIHIILRTIKLNSLSNNLNLNANKIFNMNMINSKSITTTGKLNLVSKSSINKHASVSEPKNAATQAAAAASASTTVIPPPHFEGQSKVYSPKIQQLVEQIAQLNLLEVSDLNELLRKRLNIKDVQMSYAAAGPALANAPAAASTKKAEEEAEEALPKPTKSSFKLKLVKYDESKKVALIKEIKSLGDNMNLVQAKKFIESVPQVFKDNIGKEEVEKLKAQLEKVGAVCQIE